MLQAVAVATKGGGRYRWSWAEVGAMNQSRTSLSAHAMHVEMNLFDSLMLKAKYFQCEA
jgi:hypothetical protein